METGESGETINLQHMASFENAYFAVQGDLGLFYLQHGMALAIARSVCASTPVCLAKVSTATMVTVGSAPARPGSEVTQHAQTGVSHDPLPMKRIIITSSGPRE